MRSILHGSWTLEDGPRKSFFIWAERATPSAVPQPQRLRIWRHPYAATSLEIGALLAQHLPGFDGRNAERSTRVVMLPSREMAPIVPGWLLDAAPEEDTPPVLRPWRVEGLAIPLMTALEFLVRLPRRNHRARADHRLGPDLAYWALAAKFVIELLARQRFLPGIEADAAQPLALWIPSLDEPQDLARFEQLAQAMPPACRAVTSERKARQGAQAPRPQILLEDFIRAMVDAAVRHWAAQGAQLAEPRVTSVARAGRSMPARAWLQALAAPSPQVRVSASQQATLQQLDQAWRPWVVRARPASKASFRICFRLEPPDLDTDRPSASYWTIRYFLQDLEDPSLLVPAREVWRERGDVLSYLNRRFDNPQEKLLEGLGQAATFCSAIQRSLASPTPEAAILSDQEAYTFLREGAHLLEEMGFGVLVPPWWNNPNSRLRVRVRLSADGGSPESSGLLSMRTLVNYDWEIALGDETLTREEFERLAALKKPLVQVRGRWVMLQPDQVEAAIAFWEKHRHLHQLQLDKALSLVLSSQETMDGLPLSEIETDSSLAELVAQLNRHEALQLLPPPRGLVGTLRPYQVSGYSWLAFLRRWGFGACLADDMGLGKTIQAIALILHTLETEKVHRPSLVICPTSLVGNWRREVSRFAPELRVLVHHGSHRAEGQEFVAQSTAHDLVISTYGLVRRDIDDLLQVHWGNIILDEAQNIKNPATKQARAVRRLRGDFRVALTGTPVENRLDELWSIMAFLNPGYLGSRGTFRRQYAVPIERYQDDKAASQLRRLVRPFILRRLKTDPDIVPDLPDKFESKIYCHLTREQATLYEAVVQEALTHIEEADAAGNRIQRRGRVLAMLTRLKQICNHPALYLADGSPLEARSGKLNRLCEMLEEILDVGERALVFTQFAQMGHLLQRHLRETFSQEVWFMHGSTPQRQRDEMLRAFQEDPSAPAIFVLSLKAGGTGLNLMRANHVFHYDRWWNPAVENQATDRAYRIGQTRDVQVHKFICLGTVEEHIDNLIESKRALAEHIIQDETAWVTELSTEELRELIALRAEALEID